MNENEEIENLGEEVAPDSSGTITQSPGVTREDLQEFASQIGNQVANAVTPRQEVEQYEEYVDPNNFATVEALNSHLAQREAKIRAEIMAQVQAVMAPTQIQTGKAEATRGMDELQLQAFEEILATVPKEVQAGALSDKATSEILRLAALGKAQLKNGKIPGSNDVASRDNANVSASDKADIADMMKSFGVSEKRAKEIVASAKLETRR